MPTDKTLEMDKQLEEILKTEALKQTSFNYTYIVVSIIAQTGLAIGMLIGTKLAVLICLTISIIISAYIWYKHSLRSSALDSISENKRLVYKASREAASKDGVAIKESMVAA